MTRSKRNAEILKIAEENFPWRDGEIEMGDAKDKNVMVSEGEDNGAYIRAWAWVSFEDTPLDKNKAECANCAWRGPLSALNDIKNYHERVDEDDEAEPDGECPECGCLAYDVTAPPAVIAK